MATRQFTCKSKPGRYVLEESDDAELVVDAGPLSLTFALPQWSCMVLCARDTDLSFVRSGPGFSLRLHDRAQIIPLTLDDFLPRAVEVEDLAGGLFRGFRQWTLIAEWKQRREISLNVHILSRPGESGVFVEPEILNASNREYGVSDLRFHAAFVNDDDVVADLISGRPEYVGTVGQARYVLPFASCAWRGRVSDLATQRFPPNCGHLVVSKADRALAFWYPIGHNSNSGGRTSYVHMPIAGEVRDDEVRLSWPLYQPCYGPEPDRVFPLRPGMSHRSFGIILAAGEVEHGDPWSVVRRARAAAMNREPRGTQRLPEVAWGSWTWPLPPNRDNYTEYEWEYFRRNPPKPRNPDATVAEDGCREAYLEALLPRARELGCELVWIDIHPVEAGTFRVIEERFPSGLKALRDKFRRAGLSMSLILMPDNLEFGKLDPSLEARFGAFRHSCPGHKFMCMASPWADYASGQIASLCREYDLGFAQLSFNHNNFNSPDTACAVDRHGHIPSGENAMDYARKYVATFNDLYRRIRTESPRTLIIENLPTVYDLGNPMPDMMWVGDCYHRPQMMWLMLDYMAAQRRLWPMEMRFVNYLTMNYEPGKVSAFLVANIALGNAIAVGGDLRHMDNGLKKSCRDWIRFYRTHRRQLCGNIAILDRHVIGHTLPGEFLVFVFNENQAVREVPLEFRCSWVGLRGKRFRVVEDNAVEQRVLGTVEARQDHVTWKPRVAGGNFVVLRFQEIRPRKKLSRKQRKEEDSYADVTTN